MASLIHFRKNTETGVNWVISLPGYGQNDLDCSIMSNFLKIDLHAINNEFCLEGSYLIAIPKDINVDTFSAKMLNGVLSVCAENHRPKEVKIKIH